MTIRGLAIAGLRRHARTQIAVSLGVAVATAALIGALLVGDSLRGSLREMALRRLGNLRYAVVATRGISSERASTVAAILGADNAASPSASSLRTQGSVEGADSQSRANGVQVWGVEPDFWSAVAGETGPPLESRTAAITEPLARQLGADIGDDVLLQLARAQTISPEVLLGRRDAPIESTRLKVAAILPDAGAAALSLEPSQQTPLNLFIPLSDLQRLTGEAGRVNTILIAGQKGPAEVESTTRRSRAWLEAVRRELSLSEVGLRVRVDESRGYFSLESETMLIDPIVDGAAMSVCARLQLVPSGVISYLANSIRIAGKAQPSTPYSIVAGFDPATPAGQAVFPAREGRPLQQGEILLNQWAADDLGARPGDAIELTYYVTGEFGKLATESSLFRLRAVVPMDPAIADPGYVPEYKGVTDAVHLSDWDPPFPMDLKAIRPKDEAYWDEHRTAPKAFVLLEDARRHWAEKDTRFGQLNAIHFTAADAGRIADAAAAFEAALLAALPAESLGLRIERLQENAFAAGAGTTDFGGLFIGFSFYLIAAAAILIAVLFRLNVERRAAEVGMLRATGWRSRRIARLLLTEGAVVCVVGVLVGLPAAWGYAWLMLTGLQTWWSAAVTAPELALHGSVQSCLIGGAASWLTGMVAICAALRGLGRISPRALLAGQTRAEPAVATRRSAGWRAWALIGGLAAVAAGIGVAGAMKELSLVPAFFLSGFVALVAAAILIRTLVRIQPAAIVHQPGASALLRLAWRNALRNPGRSTATAALLAMASFLVLALSAFRLEPAAEAASRTGGTGGFALFAESTTPILRDPNDWSDSPEALGGLPAPAIYPLRLQPGDAGSCLNLYLRRTPRILGATEAFVDRGGFPFAAVDGRFAEDLDNPWRLLERRRLDGEIPVIGDEAAVRWQFHKNIGDTLEIEDERGRPRTLRIVALLSGSVLQDELIVSEQAFKDLFPSRSGYSFFLVDPAARPDELGFDQRLQRRSPDGSSATEMGEAGGTRRTEGDPGRLTAVLEKRFAEYGLDVRATRDRLADYLGVQNTYLSTFQTLGGFGLLLGVLGLAAIMLRNVWERRGELALLRAMGYRTRTLGAIVILESAQVLALGIIAGVIPALVAVSPIALERPAAVPASVFLTVMVLVPAVAILAGTFALRSGLRAPVAETLKRDDI
ncbi:MAG: ABC transporter permease [Phycisphaerales bacterium]|nr:ABC transporter permease [Phycisphaerales bacterium]